jgi:hypothetical protein
LVLKGLLERLGVGGPKVGLDQQTNTVKYVLIVAGPFYAVWGVTNYLQYIGFPQEYVMMLLGVGMAVWIAGVYGVHSHMKMEAADFLVFDQAKWRFDENTVTTVDIFIPKDAIQYIGKLDEGKHAYRIGPLPYSIGYLHPDLGLISFNRADWVLPAKWNDTFFFKPGGEVFWGGIPMTHPNTEGLVLHVKGWQQKMGEYIPTCEVADSTFHYKHGMAGINPKRVDLTSEDIDKMETTVLKKENIELHLKTKDLEHHLGKVLDESVDQEKIYRERLADAKRKYVDIMRVEEPWKYRLLNLKTFAIAIVAIVVIVILARFLGFI